MSEGPGSIFIVGGGTAGWMTACYFAKTWPKSSITLIESSDIGTVGVGEGSTPYLKQFFAYLGIPEKDWMGDCDATYKVGIQFDNWTGQKAYPTYFHPFFSPLDIPSAEVFFEQANLKRVGQSADALPEHYFVAAELVRQQKIPVSPKLPTDIDYAYHFDAGKLGTLLKCHAVKLGVEHLVGNITDVSVESGLVKSVDTDNFGVRRADLFVDCSGFRGILAKQALAGQFLSYQDTLFNDAAVAIATPTDANQAISPQTKSVALKHGWMWNIPLTSRTGNGYVYSSKHCSAEEAEDELRGILGIENNPEIPARHLSMQVGRLQKHWQGNTLAIGLSQGFIEPLEATALMLVQYAAHHFCESWNRAGASSNAQDDYNKEINRMFDGIRDYIAAHYYLNERTDTPYWRDCREKMLVPENLQRLLEGWDGNGQFETALDAVDHDLVYLRPSWYCILAGMGRFAPSTTEQPRVNQSSLEHLRQTVSQYF